MIRRVRSKRPGTAQPFPDFVLVLFLRLAYKLLRGETVSKHDPNAMGINLAFRVMLSDLTTIVLSWNATIASFRDIQAVERNVTRG